MIQQADVTSGFDVELLLSEELVRQFLLCSMETGSIPWWSQSSGTKKDGTPYRTATVLHPPDSLRERRLYPVHPGFEGQEHPFRDLLDLAYSARHDEFELRFLAEDPLSNPASADLLLRLYPSIVDLLATPPLVLISNVAPVDLHLSFDVVFDARPDGLIDNIGLQLELMDVSGPLIGAAEALGQSKANILADMKEQIDRRVPFALAGGGALQAIATRKFTGGDGPNAIGVYINLALQATEAPNSLHPPRGHVVLARNLLAPGARIAFAFPAATYRKLGDDFKFKMAVPGDQPGQFHYPLMDGDKRIGQIKGVSVYAERRLPVGGGAPAPAFTNVLVIDIHGEYAIDNFFDPDFHLRIRLVPQVGDRGLLDFDIDFDLSFSAAAQIIALFLTAALSFVMPKLGLSLLFLSVLTFKLIERVGAGAAQAAVRGELDRTSFLDTLPHKLIVETRRWDPLYKTLHRLEVADTSLAVNDAGFAMDAREVFIGRRCVPLSNAVVRAATRDAEGAVDGLVYRANDIAGVIDTDLVAVYPATDRMPFVALLPPQGTIESHRVALSMEQVLERIAAQDRHLTGLDYAPRKIHLVRNTIARILAISKTELAEIESLARSRLRTELRSSAGAALRQQAHAELLAELNREPGEDEVNARLEELLKRAVDAALPGRLLIETDARMRFDLAPYEFAALQRRDIVVLGRNHLEIRQLKRNGKTTVFYRDYERPFEPDTPKHDNLRALPRYKPPVA